MAAYDFEEASGAGLSAPESDGCAYRDVDARWSEADQYRRTLERLASTFGIPVAAFFENGLDPTDGEQPTTEATALARTFLTIGDPAMRTLCLDFVKGAARHDRKIGTRD